MAVVWVKGNTVVAIPRVKECLLSATGYGTCLLKWALCVMGFSHGMEVEHLEIQVSLGLLFFLLYITGTRSQVHPLVLAQGHPMRNGG